MGGSGVKALAVRGLALHEAFSGRVGWWMRREIDQGPYPAWVCDSNACQTRKALVVKKLSYEQSRRNSARRRRRVQARHRQAGHWGERSEPMLTSQKINYEIGGNVQATPYGRNFAMHRLVHQARSGQGDRRRAEPAEDPP